MTGGVMVMLGSGVVAVLIARVIGANWRVITPPAMFCNWANLGLPLYLFAIGPMAVDGGVMLVLIGNVLLFTLGAYIYSGSVSIIELLKAPIIVSMFVGLVIGMAGVPLPEFAVTSLDMLAQGAIPLMLFSLGVRLTKIDWVGTRISIIMAIFCPVVGVSIAFLATQIIPMSELQAKILILFGVLPPAVVNFILAEHYSPHPEHVASVVLIGNLFALISFPVLLYFFL
jgi:predicted permease